MADEDEKSLFTSGHASNNHTPRSFSSVAGGGEQDPQGVISDDSFSSSFKSSTAVINPSPIQEMTVDADFDFNEEDTLLQSNNSSSQGQLSRNRQNLIQLAPLIDRQEDTDNQQQNQRRCTCTKFCCICSTFIIFILLLLMCVGIVLVVLARPPESGTTNILSKGDYVLLKINTKGTRNLPVSLFDLSLTLNVSEMADSEFANDSVVLVYKVQCNHLHLYERKKFFSKFIQSFDSGSSKHHFDNCSNYPALCLVDVYVYLLKNVSSYISHNISVYPFISGSTHLNLLVFDEQNDYKLYLDGDLGRKDAMKSTKMTSNPYTFNFSYSDTKKEQSYYFFILEEAGADKHHIPEWYQVSRSGVQVTYSGLDQIKPYRELYINSTVNNSCHTSFHLDGGYCYLGHLQITNDPSSLDATTPDEDNNIQVIARIVWTPTAKGLFISGCCILACVLIAFFIMLICLCMYFRKNCVRLCRAMNQAYYSTKIFVLKVKSQYF